jgi:diaminopimelate decarboxylase
MEAFTYRNGALCAEGVPLARIAAELGTPFYCYSGAALAGQYRTFAAAVADLDATICYALKANATLAVVRSFAELGAGADVVSEGEIRIALAAGIPPERIVFSGVGKSRSELAFALETGVAQINVESAPELELLAEVARALGRSARVAIRINPDVDARTHHKITTGKKENKFGVPLEEARRLFARGAELAPAIAMEGIAVHIGSQLTELEPYRRAFAHAAAFVRALRAEGHSVRRLDLGGGLGIAYHQERPPSIEAYAAAAREAVEGLGCALTFEPGRFLVGNAGVLVTRVLYVKQGAAHRFVIVDAGMNDLLRPALYDAYHAIVPLREPAQSAALEPAEVVGPVCESADLFARARPLPPLAGGDLLAICSAGAYASVMSSTYNGRLPAPEAMVSGERYAVIRPRPGYEELIARDRLPDWLAARKGAARGVA